MQSTIVGPYPRVGSEVGNELRRELNNIYRGSGSVQLVQRLMENLTREVVQEMVSAGIDLPNYGLVDVHDELTWPLESVEGVQFGGMKKVFHTNTHYREVIVNGEIVKRRPIVNDLCRIALEVHPEVKVELPGPYTMAKHSVFGKKSPYKTFAELARKYATLYREELSGLKDVPLVQFNEPSIIAYGRLHDDAAIVPELYEMMVSDLKLQTAVWTFYGRYTPEVLDMLLSLPVDIVGLDFVWDPDVETLVKKKCPDKGIGIGLIDSGDRGYTGLEEQDSVMSRLRSLEGYVDFQRAILSSNATLEHLPRDNAKQKIALIADITDRMN